MGLDFGKTAQQITTAVPEEKNEIEVVKEYDIVADRQQMNADLVNSKEVDDLVSTIEVHNLETIVSFGAEAAEEISKASDIVLNSMNMSQLDDSSEMLNTLAKIMSKFDIEEIKDNPGLFGKLFGNMRKQLDKILDKYHTMGDEVDKIYVQLKQYESEIKQSNRKLNQMFEANVGYYHELVKYILAGEQGCRELEAYIAQRQADMEATGDNSIQFEIQSLQQSLMMLEQRTQDLRTAENVAMQSVPMIKTMEFSNMNLVRKINSAFIVTLPVFKQALAQAIMLKRQKIQAEAMSALDQKTNEMLIKNARNTVEQSKMTAQLASGSSIKIETLETTWRTIVNGIDETKQIQENARKQRIEDQARLEKIKAEFNRMYHMPNQGKLDCTGGKQDMPINLSKGQKVDLTKGNPGLKNIMVGLGWDVNAFDSGADFDLDAAAFMVGENGKCPTEKEFVFYGNLVHPSESVKHMGDNLTGEGDGDDEQIQIDLSKIPANISKVAFTVTIYDAETRRQNFGQVSNAFIRIVDETTNQELIRYDLGEDFSIETAVVVGELYRHDGEWKFNAIGSGFQGGLAALCGHYGIDVA